MRILGFSSYWPKLEQLTFTTFRFPRQDKDWFVGEAVQIVYKPRSKERKVLGIAEIVGKASRDIYGFRSGDSLTEEEALADGFDSRLEMQEWLKQRYPLWRLWNDPMQKLTLEWREKANVQSNSE